MVGVLERLERLVGRGLSVERRACLVAEGQDEV